VVAETLSTTLNISENKFSAVLLSDEMDEPSVSLRSFLQEVNTTIAQIIAARMVEWLSVFMMVFFYLDILTLLMV
jgi:hypothetical protein